MDLTAWWRGRRNGLEARDEGRWLNVSTDRVIALIGLMVSIALIAFTLYRRTSPLFTFAGVLIAASTTYWLMMGGRIQSRPLSTEGRSSKRKGLILASMFFFLFTLTVLVLYLRPEQYQRPLSYFVLMALLVGVVAYEALILSARWKWMIMVQIALVGLSLPWSQLLIFQGLVGQDPWYHEHLTSLILSTGHVTTGFSYSMLPIMHLAVGSTSLLTGLDYKTAVMLSVSFVQVIANLLFVYLIGILITRNNKVALLGALLISVADLNVFMAAVTIPGSMAAIFVPIVLYILLRGWSNPLLIVVGMAPLMIVVVMTHTIAAAWLAITLVSSIFLYLLGRRRESGQRIVTGGIAAFFIVVLVGWWTYASGQTDTLLGLARWGFRLDSISPTAILVSVPTMERIMSAAGMYIFFAASLIGVLYIISQRSAHIGRMFGPMMLLPLAIGLGAMMGSLFINYQRWFYFAEIMLALPLAVAIVAVLRPDRRSLNRAAAIAVVTLLAFLMIMSPGASSDNHALTPTLGVRLGLTEAEYTATYAAVDIQPSLAVDAGYVDAFESRPVVSMALIDQSVISRNFTMVQDRLVVIRQDLLADTFEIAGGIDRLDYDLDRTLLEQGFSPVYCSHEVTAYAFTGD